MHVAKYRALDRQRRTTLIDGKHRELAIGLTELVQADPNIEARLDEVIDDDLLRLIFTACHTPLPAEQHPALVLRLLGGLSTPEVAHAFFVSEATVVQRIDSCLRNPGAVNDGSGIPPCWKWFV